MNTTAVIRNSGDRRAIGRQLPPSRKSLRRCGAMEMDELAGEPRCSAPAFWEAVVFRLLNGVMSVFFISAAVQLKDDDNSCLFIPTFMVPAFLCFTVAIRPQLSDCMWWKSWVVIHTVVAICLALVSLIQLIRSVHAERETYRDRAAGDEVDLPSANPLKYEEGRELLGVAIIIFWMKITSYVSKTQYRGTAMLPAPQRLVTNALYLSLVPIGSTALCIFTCSTRTSCLSLLGI